MKRSYLTLVLLTLWATSEVTYAQNRAPVRRGGGGGGFSAPSRPSMPSRPSSPSRPSGPIFSRPTPSPSRPSGPIFSRPAPSRPSGPIYSRPVPSPSRPGPIVTRPSGTGVVITRPNYPRYSPSRPIPGGVYNRIGSGNIVYGGYHTRLGQVHNRLDYMRGNVRIGSWVNLQVGYYRTHYYPTYIPRTTWYNSYYPSWRVHYSHWGRWGFYGGFYWNLRPVADIGVYFYNPMIHWFYSPHYDEYYYNTWYNSGITVYPEMRTPFPYAGVYYPTEEFKDLNLGMSQANVTAQVNYRRAMIDFTLKLQQQVSMIMGYNVSLSANDVVINHYQQLNGDVGVVIEGFVSYQQQSSYPFKAYLDLNTGNADLFVTGNSGQSPNPTEIDQLGNLNSRIQGAGGVVEGDDNPNGEIIDPSIEMQ